MSDAPRLQGGEHHLCQRLYKADGYAGLFDEAMDFTHRPDAPETAPYLYFDLPQVAPARYRLRLLKLEDSFTVTGTAPGEPLKT